jgi:hypothetical protein
MFPAPNRICGTLSAWIIACALPKPASGSKSGQWIEATRVIFLLSCLSGRKNCPTGLTLTDRSAGAGTWIEFSGGRNGVGARQLFSSCHLQFVKSENAAMKSRAETSEQPTSICCLCGDGLTPTHRRGFAWWESVERPYEAVSLTSRVSIDRFGHDHAPGAGPQTFGSSRAPANWETQMTYLVILRRHSMLTRH